METLRILRELTIANELDEIVVKDDQIQLGKRRTFPRTAQTAWKKGGKSTGTYSLETLVHFAKTLDKPLREYLVLPRAKSVALVPYLERKALQEYLHGRTETDPSIQTELLLPEAPSGLAADGEPAAKKARFDDTHRGDAGQQRDKGGLLARLLSHERQLQDRNSQMLVPDKSFKRVLELLEITKRTEQRNAQPDPNPHAAGPSQAPRPNHSEPQRPSSASRHSHSQTAPSSGQPQHPHSHSHKRPREDDPSRRSASQVAKSKPPLIIVPSAATAKINILNAKSILEEGVYVTPEQARAQGAKKQGLVLFQRKIGRSVPVMYHITDQPPDKKSHDWERVAAIFVTGAAWQFKEYPFKGASAGETVDTFTHCLGIYVGFKGESEPETVRKWNIKRFELQKADRHRDRAIVQDIWLAIDAFLGSNVQKKKLTY